MNQKNKTHCIKVNKADYKRIMAGLEERKGSMFDYYSRDKSENKRVSKPMLREGIKITNLINNLIKNVLKGNEPKN